LTGKASRISLLSIQWFFPYEALSFITEISHHPKSKKYPIVVIPQSLSLNSIGKNSNQFIVTQGVFPKKKLFLNWIDFFP